MVGWWLSALISVSEAEWWLRLPAILQPALLSFMLFAFMRDPVDGPSQATRWGVASLTLLAPASVLDVLITTDIPLVYFSVASALVFLHAVRTRNLPAFALAGLLLGGAFLSKYFAVLLGLAYVGWALWRPAVWKWKALGLIVLCALPAGLYNAWWNSGHCWSNVMFNVFNRHGNARLSWETPLLYGAMMVWLLTPMVVWGIAARAGRLVASGGLAPGWSWCRCRCSACCRWSRRSVFTGCFPSCRSSSSCTATRCGRRRCFGP
jgi:hypothetical protein